MKVKELYYILRLAAIFIGIIVAFLAYFGMLIPLKMSGDPKPVLYAKVDFENLEAPCCVDEEAKKLVGRIDDIREQVRGESERIEKLKNKYETVEETADKDYVHHLNKDILENLSIDIEGIRDPNIAENLDYKCPENIVRVMNAKALYSIIVYNNGDLESKQPKAIIPNYYYAEVINTYTETIEKYWSPNEIKLGSTIYGGTDIRVIAWVAEQVRAQDAKRIKVISKNSGPAEIFISTPVSFLARGVHKHIRLIFFTSLLLVISHFCILLGKLKKRRKPKEL